MLLWSLISDECYIYIYDTDEYIYVCMFVSVCMCDVTEEEEKLEKEWGVSQTAAINKHETVSH